MVSSDLGRQFPDGHNIPATARYFRLIEGQFVRITNTCRGCNDARCRRRRRSLKRVELAKLQDRFRYRIDLASADIREVATRRVLGKTESGRATLTGLYKRVQGQLNTNLKLDWPAGRSAVAEDEFVEFYPYPPHFIDLSIAVPIRLRRAGRVITMRIDGTDPFATAKPAARLIKLLIRAHRFNTTLVDGDSMPFAALAKREGMSPSYFTRLVRLSYLAPDITQAILEGRQPAI
jgi:hypothetical protein